MIKKHTLDILNEKSVSVKTQDFILHEGQEHSIGQPHRKAYVNSARGREEVQNELPSRQQKAIFAVWGNEPTVNETVTD